MDSKRKRFLDRSKQFLRGKGTTQSDTTSSGIDVEPTATPRSGTKQPGTGPHDAAQPATTQSAVTQPASTKPALIHTATIQPATTPPANVKTTPQTASTLPVDHAPYIIAEALAKLDDADQKVIRLQQQQNQRLTLQGTLERAEELHKSCSQGFKWQFQGKEVVLRDQAEAICSFIKKIEPLGDTLAGLDPMHAGLPWAGIKAIIAVGIASRKQRALILHGLEYVLFYRRCVDIYIEHLNGLKASAAADNLREALVAIYTCILQFCATAMQTDKLNPVAKTAQAVLWPKAALVDFEEKIEECRDRLREAAAQTAQQLDQKGWQMLDERLQELDRLRSIENSIEDISQQIALTNLEWVRGARHDSHDGSRSQTCLAGTRVDLLRKIDDWLSIEGEDIFWLCGKAGTGKSTILRTVAQRLDQRHEIVISFFFKRGEAGRDTAKFLFPTLVRQLVDAIPATRPYVAQALRDSTICDAAIERQFSTLLEKPLQQCNMVAEVFVVLDALDEFDNEQDARRIINLFSKLLGKSGATLRVMITSRPNMAIIDEFRATKHVGAKLESVQEVSIAHDIELFILDRLCAVRSKLAARSGSTDWPTASDVQALTDLSMPLFEAAATYCRFIVRLDSKARLRKIIEMPRSNTGALGDFYNPVLQAYTQDHDDYSKAETMEIFRQLVGAVVVVLDPLSPEALGNLLGLPTELVLDTIESLRSVLDLPQSEDQPVRPFHLSFRDYLLDPKLHHDFRVDEKSTHEMLFMRCLELLQQQDVLVENTCHHDDLGHSSVGMPTFEIESKNSIPKLIQYCSEYWIQHANDGVLRAEHCELIASFLKIYFLRWVETLALLRKLPATIRRMQILQGTVTALIASDDSQRSSGEERQGIGELHSFLADARRFIIQNRDCLEKHPLEVYRSVLYFTPATNRVRQHFFEICELHVNSIFEHVNVAAADSDNVIWSMEAQVRVAALSHNKQYIALMDHDGRISHCEADTGHVLTQFRDGVALNPGLELTYTPDDTCIMAVIDDVIEVWNIASRRIEKTYHFEDDLGAQGATVLALSGDGRFAITRKHICVPSGSMVDDYASFQARIAETGAVVIADDLIDEDGQRSNVPIDTMVACASVVLHDFDSAKSTTLLPPEIDPEGIRAIFSKPHGHSIALSWEHFIEDGLTQMHRLSTQVWDTRSVQLLLDLAPYVSDKRGGMPILSADPAHYLAFIAPAGPIHRDTSLCVWDIWRRKLACTIDVSLGQRMGFLQDDISVEHMTFHESSLGLELATVSTNSNNLRRWRIGTDMEELYDGFLLDKHERPLLIFLDGLNAVLSSEDGVTMLRAMIKQTAVRRSDDDTGWNIVAADAAESCFYSTVSDGRLRRWDSQGAQSYEVSPEIRFDRPSLLFGNSSVAMMTDDFRNEEQLIQIWHASYGQYLHTMRLLWGSRILALAPDGSAIVWFDGEEEEIRVRDLASGTTTTLLNVEEDYGPTGAAYSSDGRNLAAAILSDKILLAVFDAQSLQQLTKLEVPRKTPRRKFVGIHFSDQCNNVEPHCPGTTIQAGDCAIHVDGSVVMVSGSYLYEHQECFIPKSSFRMDGEWLSYDNRKLFRLARHVRGNWASFGRNIAVNNPAGQMCFFTIREDLL